MFGFSALGETPFGESSTGDASFSLPSVVGTSAVGTLTLVANVRLSTITGVQGTSAAGAVAGIQTATPVLDSILGDLAAGTIVAEGNALANVLASVLATGAVGTLEAEATEPLVSVVSTGALGDLTLIANSTIVSDNALGTSAVSLASTPATAQVNIGVTGNASTSSLGTITASGVQFVFPIADRNFARGRTITIPRDQGNTRVFITR